MAVLEAATGAELMRSDLLHRHGQPQPCAFAAAPGEAATAALAWPDRLQVFVAPWHAAECKVLASYDVPVRFATR